MGNTRKLLAIFAVALLGGYLGSRLNLPTVHAQSPNVYIMTGAWATHTACVPTAGQMSICYASDGIWQSLSGGGFTQIGGPPVATGVTSWNGLTGAVVYTPPAAPVLSVNGKTGTVVLAATTALN